MFSKGLHVVPTLVITGPVGVGKTSALYEVASLLEAEGAPHAALDMDALRAAYPAPPDDRFNERLGLRNLALVWREFAEAGAKWLLLADVVERADQRDLYTAAIPGAVLFVVRLRAPLDELLVRVRRRELGAGREWHMNRAAELAEQMDRDALEDAVIQTAGRDVTSVAGEVLQVWRADFGY